LRWLEKRECFYITWTEHGRSRERSTGTADREQAEIIFAEWLHRRGRRAGPSDRASILATDVLNEYAEQRGPKTAAPARIAYAVDALIDFFEGNSLADVTPQTCGRSFERLSVSPFGRASFNCEGSRIPRTRSRQLVQPAEDRLLSQWGVEDAVDFHDVIVKQAPDFDHRARWIWRFTPEFCLRFLHHRCEPVQVAYVNGKPYAILEARSDGDAESVIFSAG